MIRRIVVILICACVCFAFTEAILFVVRERMDQLQEYLIEISLCILTAVAITRGGKDWNV